MKRSGSNPNSLRDNACEELLGYASKSQPFSRELGLSKHSFTFYKNETKGIYQN